MTTVVSLKSTSNTSVNHRYGIKHKPTKIKNPQVNAILEPVHQAIMGMLCTAEIDMNDKVSEKQISDLIPDHSWVICSTYHAVLKASPEAAILEGTCYMAFPISTTDKKIGEYRQKQTTSIPHTRTAAGMISTM